MHDSGRRQVLPVPQTLTGAITDRVVPPFSFAIFGVGIMDLVIFDAREQCI